MAPWRSTTTRYHHHGLAYLAQHISHTSASGPITAANIRAVGDQLNDMSMVEAAGLGVAMGNGSDDLKAAANFICGRYDEDGIVDVVNHIKAYNKNVRQ